MHVRNVIGDGVTFHRPVIQAGRFGFGDDRPSSGLDLLDIQGGRSRSRRASTRR